MSTAAASAGPPDLADAAAVLRRIIDAIDTGELEATAAQRAYLVGIADALIVVFERSL